MVDADLPYPARAAVGRDHLQRADIVRFTLGVGDAEVLQPQHGPVGQLVLPGQDLIVRRAAQREDARRAEDHAQQREMGDHRAEPAERRREPYGALSFPLSLPPAPAEIAGQFFGGGSAQRKELGGLRPLGRRGPAGGHGAKLRDRAQRQIHRKQRRQRQEHPPGKEPVQPHSEDHVIRAGKGLGVIALALSLRDHGADHRADEHRQEQQHAEAHGAEKGKDFFHDRFIL